MSDPIVSRKFAGWYANEAINRSTYFGDLSDAERMELELLLVTAFWAGMNYDETKNKIPELKKV